MLTYNNVVETYTMPEEKEIVALIIETTNGYHIYYSPYKCPCFVKCDSLKEARETIKQQRPYANISV